MMRSFFAELASSDFLPPALLVFKVSLLLVLGFAVSGLLRRASAAARHLVWLLVLGASAATLILAPVAPPIAVPVPVVAARAPRMAETVVPVRVANASTSEVATQRSRGDAPATAPTQTFASRSAIDASRAIMLVWLGGAFLVLAWLAFGHLALIRLRRGSIPLDSVSWRRVIEETTAISGIRTRVVVLENTRMRTPVTWGLIQPIIVLPAGATDWSDERKLVVLMHEMAHIARGDFISQLVASVTCALFWYHPGMWLAARRLRVEAERACDDAVLGAGMRGVVYAEHLLDVARRMRVMRLIGPAAVGMARPSHLEERLMAVLTDVPSRRPISARVARIAAVITMVAMLPLAGTRPELAAAPTTTVIRDDGVRPAQATTPTKAVQPAFVSSTIATTSRPSTVAVVQTRSEWDFEDSVAASPDGELSIDFKTGASLDVRGWDKPWVRVRATLDGPDARRTRVTLTRKEYGAVLRTTLVGDDRNSSTSHKFEIRVPSTYNMRLHSAGGAITLADISGEFTGSTGGGDMVIRRVQGRLELSTGGGDIHVSQSNVSGRVSTGGGAVVLADVKGGLRGSSGSGPVVYGDDVDAAGRVGDLKIDGERIDVGRGTTFTTGGSKSTSTTTTTIVDPPRDYPGTHYGLNVSKAGGNIELKGAPNGAKLHTGGGRIVVGASAGVVNATTGGGDIRLGPIDGSAIASTGAGDIHIILIDANGDEHDVDVTSGTGDVILELPASLDARFELETAYTEGHRSKSRISSDFDLSQGESEDWEYRYGTPRKFIRATGSVGSGRSLIRVRTVNGSITVKRTR